MSRPWVRINKIINLELTQDFRVPSRPNYLSGAALRKASSREAEMDRHLHGSLAGSTLFFVKLIPLAARLRGSASRTRWCGDRRSERGSICGLQSARNRLICDARRCKRFGRKPLIFQPSKLTLNQRVQGSSPCAPTKNSQENMDLLDGGAEPGERSAFVSGLCPVMRTPPTICITSVERLI